MIYFDNSATTKPKQEVVDAILPYLTEHWYNPSSLYLSANKIKQDIETARKIIADFIKSQPEEIYFTSSASESNSWVIRGWDDLHMNTNSIIITTPIEHKSVMMALENPVLWSKVCYCDVDEYGFVDMMSLQKLLDEHDGWNILVTIGAANSEIGTIQPIKEIARMVHEHDNAVFHTDSTQLLPNQKIDVFDISIDLMSASAQKFGGVKGVGFLYKKSGIELNTLIWGTQEGFLRGGTENVAGIIGMAKAIELVENDITNVESVIKKRDYFMNALRELGCVPNGADINRLPNNVNVILPDGCGGEELLYILDVSGVCISTGSACSSHMKEPSYVLKAIGLSDEEAARTIRITISHDTTFEEIDYVIDEIEKGIRLLGGIM